MADSGFAPVFLRNATAFCEAIYRGLVAPEDAVRGKVFNVLQDSEKYGVREVAQILADELPGCEFSTALARAVWTTVATT